MLKVPAMPCMLLKVDVFVLLLASVLPCKYVAQVAGDQMGLP